MAPFVWMLVFTSAFAANVGFGTMNAMVGNASPAAFSFGVAAFLLPITIAAAVKTIL